MKIITHILLLLFCTGAGIPKGDFSQLTKISNLITHYELHQQEAAAVGETISFTDFLYLHFVAVDEHDHETDNNHDNLPLQHISTANFFLTTVTFSCFIQPIFTATAKATSANIISCEEVPTVYHPPCLLRHEKLVG